METTLSLDAGQAALVLSALSSFAGQPGLASDQAKRLAGHVAFSDDAGAPAVVAWRSLDAAVRVAFQPGTAVGRLDPTVSVSAQWLARAAVLAKDVGAQKLSLSYDEPSGTLTVSADTRELGSAQVTTGVADPFSWSAPGQAVAEISTEVLASALGRAVIAALHQDQLQQCHSFAIVEHEGHPTLLATNSYIAISQSLAPQCLAEGWEAHFSSPKIVRAALQLVKTHLGTSVHLHLSSGVAYIAGAGAVVATRLDASPSSVLGAIPGVFAGLPAATAEVAVPASVGVKWSRILAGTGESIVFSVEPEGCAISSAKPRAANEGETLRVPRGVLASSGLAQAAIPAQMWLRAINAMARKPAVANVTRDAADATPDDEQGDDSGSIRVALTSWQADHSVLGFLMTRAEEPGLQLYAAGQTVTAVIPRQAAPVAA